MVQTFDISHLDYLIYQNSYLRSTALGCKDRGIRKFEFAANTQILCNSSLSLPWASKTIFTLFSGRKIYRVGMNKVNNVAQSGITNLTSRSSEIWMILYLFSRL